MTARAILGLAKGGENRSSTRKTLRLIVSGRRTNQQATEALIHDLSREGMLIESGEPFRIDEAFAVELPSGGLREAVVVWSSTRFYGCRFAKPLSRAAVSAALLKAHRASDKSATEDHGKAPPTEFAAKITGRREELGLSIEQLARRLSVSRQAVWYWETGQRVPRNNLSARIARELGLDEFQLTPSKEYREAAPGTIQAFKALIAAQFEVGVENVRITVEL